MVKYLPLRRGPQSPWVLHFTGGIIGSSGHFTGGIVSKGPKKWGPPLVPSGSSGPPGQVGQHGNTSYWVFKWVYTKWERLLPKNQHTWRKLSNFENLSNGEVTKSVKIQHSKSISYVKNHGNLSHLIFMEEYQFRSRYFVIDIFW